MVIRTLSELSLMSFVAGLIIVVSHYPPVFPHTKFCHPIKKKKKIITEAATVSALQKTCASLKLETVVEI